VWASIRYSSAYRENVGVVGRMGRDRESERKRERERETEVY
jgi:hypothetical protein